MVNHSSTTGAYAKQGMQVSTMRVQWDARPFCGRFFSSRCFASVQCGKRGNFGPAPPAFEPQPSSLRSPRLLLLRVCARGDMGCSSGHQVNSSRAPHQCLFLSVVLRLLQFNCLGSYPWVCVCVWHVCRCIHERAIKSESKRTLRFLRRHGGRRSAQAVTATGSLAPGQSASYPIALQSNPIKSDSKESRRGRRTHLWTGGPSFVPDLYKPETNPKPKPTEHLCAERARASFAVT